MSLRLHFGIYFTQYSIGLDQESGVLRTSCPLLHAEGPGDLVVLILDHRDLHRVPGYPLPVGLHFISGYPDNLDVEGREVIQQAAEPSGNGPSWTYRRNQAITDFIDDSALWGEPENRSPARCADID